MLLPSKRILAVHRLRIIAAVLIFSGSCLFGAPVPNSLPLSSFRLNGSARLTSPTVITLTSGSYQAASAFLPSPYTLGPGDNFSAFFAYQAQPPAVGPPADGIAFVVQNLGPNSAQYLGLSGSGLGFFTLTSIPAIAVTFDYYVNAITGTAPGTLSISTPAGVNLSQAVPSLATFPGSSFYRAVWIQYNGAQRTLQVFYGSTPVKPATPSLSTVLPVDLATLLAGQIYFGITAGTGALYSSQELNYFAVQVN